MLYKIGTNHRQIAQNTNPDNLSSLNAYDYARWYRNGNNNISLNTCCKDFYNQFVTHYTLPRFEVTINTATNNWSSHLRDYMSMQYTGNNNSYPQETISIEFSYLLGPGVAAQVELWGNNINDQYYPFEFNENDFTFFNIMINGSEDFNNQFIWFFENGSFANGKTPVYVDRVITHELGHVLGLHHYEGSQQSIMLDETQAAYYNTAVPTPIDLQYLNFLYPFTPSENDEQLIPSAKSTFSSYPNPARDQLTFELKTDRSAQDYEISIYNIKGQLVKKTPFHHESKISWKFDSTDKQNISSGIYFAVLKENGAIISSKKIMIIK
jgi:hypothetical protein